VSGFGVAAGFATTARGCDPISESFGAWALAFGADPGAAVANVNARARTKAAGRDRSKRDQSEG
jgi:hypothetical protein